MNLAEKARLIRLANAWEASYAKSLQRDVLRELALIGLGEIVTEQFLEEEIEECYGQKLEDKEYALACDFPVPPDDELTENSDGSVSFGQHVHIEWSGGQVDDFDVVHTYHFEDDLIAAETGPPGVQIRRKHELGPR